MTETLHEPPPIPPPPPSAPPLVRDPDDRVVAGVCAALGRTTGTDPVLWRVTVAVLAVFGGAGVVLYLLAWLLVPLRGETRSVAERTLRRSDGSVAVLGVVLAVVVAVLLLGALDDGPGAAALLVVAGIGYLVVRERRGTGLPLASPVYGPEPAPVAWTAPVERAPRVRSRLGAVTVSLAVLVVGVLLLLREHGADGLTAPRVVASALLVVGGGLVVGTWYGRARWLLAVGALLALLLAATAAADAAGVHGGVGERTWRPETTSGSYRLAAGSAVLDLRAVPRGSDGTFRARVGVGELVVLVPRRTTARVDVEVGLGEVSGPDGRLGLEDDGTELREQFVVGSSDDDVVIELDLEVGAGEVEVRRVP